MTGVEGIPDDVLERAVEAAAKAYRAIAYVTTHPEWDYLDEGVKVFYRNEVRPIVTVALAEVEASIKAQALREYADSGRHPWTVFRRDDGSPVTVNDHMRETADRLEAGEQ